MTEEMYMEFNKEYYDDAKNIIKGLLKSPLKEETIYNFNSVQNMIEEELSDEYISIWTNLVDYVKALRNGNCPGIVGTIINGDNCVKDYYVPQGDNTAWQIFKNQLENKEINGKKIYSMEEVEGLEQNTLTILKNLSEDTSEGSAVKGLVMGYVQSGKTTSIEALITMAADWGYNVFIMLSGIIENLRIQNLNRLKKDIEYGDNGNIHWNFVDGRNLTLTPIQDLIESRKKIVIVNLKNSKRLSNLENWLLHASDATLKKAKILIIDDEADQAGLNTCDINNNERSVINGQITKLLDNYLNKFGAMNYIGYTATPYGNFLNEEGSIYPKDFIFMLPKSKKYIGAQEIFGYEELLDKKVDGLNIKREITKDELKVINSIENGEHSSLPKSLKDAVCWFICCLATYRKKNIVAPLTMLIHTNRKTKTQKQISDAISDWINNNVKENLLYRCRKVYEKEVNKLTRQNFYDVMDNYGTLIEDYLSFEEIEEDIQEILSIHVDYAKNIEQEVKYSRGLHSVIDNCVISSVLDETENPRLAYPEKDKVDFATGFIVTGGDTLSRGLTLEGLVVTYFCRKVLTCDTLMQMGRWFGYRVGYELMPRIWLDDKNLQQFIDLTKVEIELRRDLEKYEFGVSPKECGPIINIEFNSRMNITSKSKSQSATTAEFDFSGISNQTVLFDNNINTHDYNLLCTNNFINKLNFEESKTVKGNLVSYNVNYDEIIDYLKKYIFCGESSFAKNKDNFCNWVLKNEKCEKWNVILGGTTSGVKGNWPVGKVLRTKINRYDNEKYFSIGALRNPGDVISDMKENEIVGCNTEKERLEARSKYNIPQLIIYNIDASGYPKSYTSNRSPINMQCDIIGLYINIPGVPRKSGTKSITISLSNRGDDE